MLKIQQSLIIKLFLICYSKICQSPSQQNTSPDTHKKCKPIRSQNSINSPQILCVINLLFMDLRQPRKKYDDMHQEKIDLNVVLTMKNGHSQKINKLEAIFNELELDKIQEVWAERGSYNKIGLKRYVPLIKQWKSTKLYLWSNKNSNICRQIEHIFFPSLIEIHIGWNNIQSIENLCLVQMPGLKELILRQNKINSINVIKKCHFPNLQVLCLRGNFIRQIQMEDWNFPLLKELNLNSNLFTDFRPALNLCAQNLKVFKLRSQQQFRYVSPILEVQVAKRFAKNKQTAL